VISGVLVVGSSGHARVLVDIIEVAGTYKILGLLDDSKPKGSIELGYPILGTVSDLFEIARKHNPSGFIVAIGDNWNRALVTAKITQMAPALRAITAVHPSAHVARTARIGEGTAVMAGAVINSAASIGRYCIVNTRAAVDHDARLEDYASVGPGATLAGNVHVGAYSAICLQACVSEKVSIGSHTVVGAGSVVLRDLPGEVLAYGTPARVINSRCKNDRYLR
jgi:sugar O-acyltransferase (sialic acid O-acetyltransferase NeuD family)